MMTNILNPLFGHNMYDVSIPSNIENFITLLIAYDEVTIPLGTSNITYRLKNGIVERMLENGNFIETDVSLSHLIYQVKDLSVEDWVNIKKGCKKNNLITLSALSI